MKKITYILLALLCSTFASCGDDAWSNGDPDMEHVYYIGFEDWGKFKNDVKFNVNQGETATVPMQFWCEFVRPYDVTTYYYVVSKLTRGTDYEIVDANGNVLQPSGDAYTLTWPQARKGVQNIYVKALNGTKGTVTVQTFNPNSGMELSNQDLESTVQSRTDQYEVRIFTQNYMVAVNIK